MAEKAGFCAGVKKAVALALAAAKQGLIYSLGPLAHNEHLIRHLANHGVQQVDDLAEVPEGATVIIRTHGVRPEVLQAAAERGLNIINATCVFAKAAAAGRLNRGRTAGSHCWCPPHPKYKVYWVGVVINLLLSSHLKKFHSCRVWM